MIEYLDEVIRPLVLILPKMSEYGETFTDKCRDKKVFAYSDDKLLEKYKTIWTKIEDLKKIELDALPVYHDRYIKTKIKTYGDKL